MVALDRRRPPASFQSRWANLGLLESRKTRPVAAESGPSTGTLNEPGYIIGTLNEHLSGEPIVMCV